MYVDEYLQESIDVHNIKLDDIDVRIIAPEGSNRRT